MTRARVRTMLRLPDPVVYFGEWAAVLLLLIAVEVGSMMFVDLLR